jgi:hypothetical protein
MYVETLLRHHHWSVDQTWGVDYMEEMRQLAHEARKMARLYDEQPQLMVGVPCKRCFRFQLLRYPGDPKVPGDPNVECANASCQAVLRPAEFEQWRQLYAQSPKVALSEAMTAARLRATADDLVGMPGMGGTVAKLKRWADEQVTA